MTDAVIEYKDLIKEAFIGPIRTVTIIDDEYPTLVSLLNSKIGHQDALKNNQTNEANLERLKNIISMCHDQYKWSVDVFDGNCPRLGENEEMPLHLNHSDLVILDYHLNGEPTVDGGQRARNIIKTLNLNNHFNIVLVHTKGNDGEIESVFKDILLDLYHIQIPDDLLPAPETESAVSTWLDDNEGGKDCPWIIHNFSELLFLDVLRCPDPKKALNTKHPKYPFPGFKNDIIEIAKKINISQEELVKWKMLELLKNSISTDNSVKGIPKWHWDKEGYNYIGTGRVFVSVIKKSDVENPSSELYEALNLSLTQFNPSPMRLLMAKMRHELDERGIEQASLIIENRYTQAAWLYDLINNYTNPLAHDKAIDLHWEQLARSTKEELRKFSTSLSNTILRIDPNKKQIIKHFFKDCVGNNGLALGHLNAFACSTPVMNSHLITGSVLKMDNDYWICLTPACDLVPGQRLGQWSERIGKEYLVFKGVKLNSININKANESASSNEFLYLNINGKPLSYNLGDGNPIWDTFYANNLGKLSNDKSVKLLCIRKQDDNLILKEVIACVIAELRYEYALNFLHKFGSNQTRVGLGFVTIDGMWS